MGSQRPKDVRKRKAQFNRTWVTRAQAVRKLQIRVKDFRRLSILKGVYPRQPKNIPETKKGEVRKGSVFYLNKDITWMSDDPILNKFRQFFNYNKKLDRLITRGDFEKARALKNHHKPQYSLVNTIKERYPTFLEALREMDDALCHVYLYAALPPQLSHDSTIEGHKDLTTKLSAKCKALVERFNTYVVKEHALRKSFLSIKGIYYQGSVNDVTVTWLVPYKFVTQMPGDVDYSVMISFLEFYTTFLDFIFFRLEKEQAARLAETQEKEEEGEDEAEDFPMDPTEQKKADTSKACANLFKDFVFYLGTETPQEQLSFVTRSFGGRVVADVKDEAITHHIIDRPSVLGQKYDSRDYVQPQWVFDCINNKTILPVDQYGIGKKLPPHLSPFDDNAVKDRYDNAYVPDRMKEIRKLIDPNYVEEKEEGEEAVEDEYATSEEESADEAGFNDDGMVTDEEDGDITEEDESETDEEDEEDEEEEVNPGAKKPKNRNRIAMLKERSKEKRNKQREAERTAERAKIVADEAAAKKKEKLAKKEKREKQMRANLLSGKKRKLWEKVTKSMEKMDRNVDRLSKRATMLKDGKMRVGEGGVLEDGRVSKKKKRAKKETTPEERAIKNKKRKEKAKSSKKRDKALLY